MKKTAEQNPPAASEELGCLSLNDIAGCLVQLEPDDPAGLAHLRDALQNMAATALPPSCHEIISLAAQKLELLIDNEAVADPQDLISEVGNLLEAAINAAEENEMTPPAEAAPAVSRPPAPGQNPAPPVETTAPEAPQLNYLPESADFELLSEFITEGHDLISSAEEALLSLETDPEDKEAVGTVFRAFHTIKGTSAFMELTLLSDLSHRAESLLSRVRDKEIRYSGGYADLALQALDMIKTLVESVQAAIGGEPYPTPAGYDELMRLLTNPEQAGISDKQGDEPPPPRIGDLLVAQGKVDRARLEEIETSRNQKPLGVSLVKSKAASLTDVGRALRAQDRLKGSSQNQGVESSVRVRTDHLDRVIDMVGELVIAQSMVAQDEIVTSASHHELQKKVTHTNKIVRELQDLSMSMRMIPLKATFKKMARLVRDISRKVGKNVNLVTEGEDTEIDRNMVDIINDPLMHMVRNAVDHGIELPEVRKEKGKPPQGTVKLAAYHSAGSVVVEIRDDGKGLSRDTILAKAKERGLVGDDSTFSDREVFNLIFEAGFSTAKTVTDVSGRGVGMDVVRKNIQALRGQVEISSEPDQGSVFKMRLPLTLAIIDGMVVRVGREKYVIPTLSIVSSIKPDRKDLSTVLNNGELLSFQGHLIPLCRLNTLFQLPGDGKKSAEELVVVVENEERKVGVFIDELIGRQQVVIKSLGDNLRHIPGISGGAVMPNGRVGLILDIGGVVKLANSHRGESLRN